MMKEKIKVVQCFLKTTMKKYPVPWETMQF